MDRVGPGVDWRDAAAYAPLLGADRSILAWEWLRRDPAYRDAASASKNGEVGPGPNLPADWGLHAFEPPDRTAPAARPLWIADLHPPVLTAAAEPPVRAADAFDISRLRPLVTIVDAGSGREHLLITDGLRAIRLDVVAGSVHAAPVQLRFLIAGLEAAERPLLTLRRLLALCRGGRFSPALHPPDTRTGRFVLMLRAHDALADGATQREIAATLLSVEAAAERWRVSAPTLRARAQRLVRAARFMAAGGYRSLLA
jgi:hypothetical protein